MVSCFVFFFQAEDGIRDVAVTGVQTCALPISSTGTVFPSVSVMVRSYRSPTRRAEMSLRRGSPDVNGMSRSAAGSDDVKDRKSTRLNSSHGYISYAVFCLKKKKETTRHGMSTD